MAASLTVRVTDAGREIEPTEAPTIRAALRHALAHLDGPASVHIERTGGSWTICSAWARLAVSGVVLNVDVEAGAALAALGLGKWPKRSAEPNRVPLHEL